MPGPHTLQELQEHPLTSDQNATSRPARGTALASERTLLRQCLPTSRRLGSSAMRGLRSR